MDTELNLPTKRRHDSESAFPYSGHSADCNCSCYLNETRLGRQRHSKEHENSLSPVTDFARPPSVHSSNDWRTSSTRRAESHSNLNSTQIADPTGHILDLPPAWLSKNGRDNPNLDLCEREGIREPIASGSPWMQQTLWDSGEPTKTFPELKERGNLDHLAQDIRASNSNELLGISPETRAPLLPNSNNA